jgi:hypothetical protein
LLFEKLKLCYDVWIEGHKVASIQGGWRAASEGNDFFIRIRCNPLKSPDSEKEMKGNESLFIFISFHFLAE